MKIEAGESLVYSWMRHIMKCQIVQTNWKTSPKWDLAHADELEALFNEVAEYFLENYELEVFKKSGFRQALQQVECDVIGQSCSEDGGELFAAEVAFHEGGLNYGSKDVTLAKVLSKLARIAFCLHGYFGASRGVVLFASPKINPAIYDPLVQCVHELERIFSARGMGFAFMVVANEEFTSDILDPVLELSYAVADTSELFLRCYQLTGMRTEPKICGSNVASRPRGTARRATEPLEHDDEFAHLKVGQLANMKVRRILESGAVSPEEVELMTTREYSFDTFHLSFCCLVRHRDSTNDVRYYAEPVNIRGSRYYLCSQWVERHSLNHRPYLLEWIRKHSIEQ